MRLLQKSKFTDYWSDGFFKLTENKTDDFLLFANITVRPIFGADSKTVKQSYFCKNTKKTKTLFKSRQLF